MSEEARSGSRAFEVLLTAAATALGVAFFASVPYWPKEAIEKAPLRGPSVLASARPAPNLNLSLPDDLASLVRRTGINGETGLIPTAASITTFRLRASGDLVSVAAPTGVDAVQPLRGDPDPAFRVRGFYAQATTERGNTVIRWTERGVTYEISSRTLDANRLAE